MIPKIIHYCWFGQNPKPSLLHRCLASWKKYCPDYEIIEWNEDNFDLNCCNYVREAYDAKKWAFVTDYARLKIVYDHGGIYLDTDVELLKSFDDLLDYPSFFGFEDGQSVNTGLGFGAEKGNPIVEDMLRGYDNIHFFQPNGTLDLLPCPIRNTKAIQSRLEGHSSAIIRTPDGVFFPPEYFCPLSPDGSTKHITENTFSIHWFSASWLDEDEKVVHDYRLLRVKFEKIFGKRFGSFLIRGLYLMMPKKREILKRM